jgi:hypothetical protein
VVESRHNRSQLNIRGNKHTSNATNDFLDATGTSAIATKFALYTTNFHRGHRHALSQPIKYSWQQTHIYRNIKSILSNAQSVVAIATHKGNHHFHRAINTNLLQQLFQQTQPTFLVAITPRYHNALIRWLL